MAGAEYIEPNRHNKSMKIAQVAPLWERVPPHGALQTSRESLDR